MRIQVKNHIYATLADCNLIPPFSHLSEIESCKNLADILEIKFRLSANKVKHGQLIWFAKNLARWRQK